MKGEQALLARSAANKLELDSPARLRPLTEGDTRLPARSACLLDCGMGPGW